MKRIMLLILLLPFVHAEWIYDLADAEIGVAMSSELRLTGSARSVEVEISSIPYEDYRQSFVADYQGGELFDDHILYRWDSPGKDIDFGYDATFKTSSKFADVRAKVPFPLGDIPSMAKYLVCTDKVDCNAETIISKAEELSAGKNDLYDVVFTFATYSSDTLEYDLSYAGVIASASDTLKDRRGVCSEYTTLFLALCRASGIPARYVSGEAYSNLEALEGFGEHAWAEVYFPGFGWVPFDPTYGEYGMVDTSHVALKKGVDPDESSSVFRWVSNNVDVISNDLDFDAELLKKGEKISPFMEIDPKFTSKINLGSYGLLSLDVTNLLNTYVTSTFFVAGPEELKVEDPKRNIFLSPFETKTLRWIFKLDEGLAENNFYEFPMKIYSKHLNQTIKVSVRRNFPFYSRNEVLAMDGRFLSHEINLTCVTDSQQSIGDVEVVCEAVNSGAPRTIEFCGFGECRNVSIVDSIKENFHKQFDSPGRFELNFSAGKTTEFLNVKIIDSPLIEILNVTAPDSAHPGGIFDISFVLKRSDSYPQDVKFYLIHKNIKKEWSTQVMTSEHVRIKEKVNGGVLSLKDNRFLIKVIYTDIDGVNYCDDTTFLINLDDIGWFQKVKIFIFEMFSTDKNDIDSEKCKR